MISSRSSGPYPSRSARDAIAVDSSGRTSSPGPGEAPGTLRLAMGGRSVGVLVIGLVLLAGCDAPTRPERQGQTSSVTVDGTLGADGSAALTEHVAFVGEHGGVVALRAPVLASVKDVSVDGSPRTDSTTSGSVQLRVLRPDATVAARVEGIAERYADIVVVTV